MKKETIKGVNLTLITDDNDGVKKEQLTEGLGIRKKNDKEFVFTKAPRQRVYCKKNPRIYNGAVVHSSLRKDGKYGLSACIDPVRDFRIQECVATTEFFEALKKIGAII